MIYYSWLSFSLAVLALALYILVGFVQKQSRADNEQRQRVFDVATSVMDLACNYDPQENEAVRKFKPIASKSQCLFAKAAVLWGNKDWDDALSLEANVRQSLPMLLQFILRSASAGPNVPMEELDGFLFEIRGKQFGQTVHAFGECVRRVLTEISRHDPNGDFPMQKNYVGNRGWVFRFGGQSIFVTSFAPCYPHHSSRYMFKESSDSSFLLLQPESSFLYHQLPADTPHTNWTAPQTIRDRIRANFRKKGREYEIPNTVLYPPAHHIVKPVDWKNSKVVEWWRRPQARESQ